jgi:glycyl-tRNA synthetase beta chain
MENKGCEIDLINSVVSTGDPLKNILLTEEKIHSLKTFNEENKNLFNPFLTAAKRLVRIVENTSNGSIDTSLLKTDQEKTLLQSFQQIKSKNYKSTNDYLKELSSLTIPINNFFEKVLVNDPDPKIKQARQSLLKQGKDLFEQICDFNKIQDRS